MKTQVAIIGAGLAGLGCALRLQEAGIEAVILEASDEVGGRVRTDLVDGFRLDRGFQVLLEAYPEARRVLDYDSLELRPFLPGAKVLVEGRLHTVADPLRAPLHVLDTLNAPIGSLADKLRVLTLRNRAMKGTLGQLFRRPETTTLEALQQIGFSRQMIECFLAPWLGGIFLGRDLSTSSRMLEFVMRMMAMGDTSVPAQGMGEIPRQLAARLAESTTLRLNTPVSRVQSGTVELQDGEIIHAEHIVVAVEAPAAARLLDRPGIAVQGRSVRCLYYALDETPVDGPWLILDGDRSGPINNLAFMSQVSRDYAPDRSELAAVTVLDDGGRNEIGLRKAVERQLRRWFGGSSQEWRFIADYKIPHAQPAQALGFREERSGPLQALPGVTLCGDYRETASINGALRSGRQAAILVARTFGREAVTS
ncbi:NAD(P)-binding protein [bacterium]|nr:NAD(P)-binding protein [bacterium]